MPKNRAYLALAALVLLGALLYLPSLSGDWLGDDYLLVVDANCADSLQDISKIATLDAGQCNYRPVRYISYALDAAVWGNDPWGYRLTNLLLHLLATVLAFFLGRAVGLAQRSALLVAAVFCLHPVQADAVAYISGRRDVLMGLFYVAAALLATHASRSRNLPPPQRWILGATALLLSVLAILTKEMAVTAPLMVLFLLTLGPAFGEEASNSEVAANIWSRTKGWLPLVIVGTVMCFFWIYYRGYAHPVSSIADEWLGGSIYRHVLAMVSISGKYVELLLVPIRLAGDYRPPITTIPSSPFSLPVLVGLLWNGILLYWALKAWRQRQYLQFFGVAWYLIGMLPVSNIIPHHEYAAEHYLYIPLIGLSIALAAAIDARLEGPITASANRLLVACLIVALAALSVRTAYRAADYRSELAHASATLAWYPESVRGHARVGLALLRESRFDAARPHLEFVLASTPRDSIPRKDVLRELGVYYANHGKRGLAIRLLEEHASFDAQNTRVLHHLAKAYIESQRFSKALPVLEQLANTKPDNPLYSYFLLLAAHQAGRTELARRTVERALREAPKDFATLLLAARVMKNEEPERARSIAKKARREATSAQQREQANEFLRSLE
jgi:tetratricopeptide (TPR) repeat protein